MAIVNLFQSLARLILGEDTAQEPDWPPPSLVERAIEAVVDSVDPRIRLSPRYQSRLSGAVKDTLLHLRGLGRSTLWTPLELSPAAWNERGPIRAFFATAQEIPRLVGRCDELRAFFSAPEHAAVDTAYLLLVMRMHERVVFAPALAGERVMHDVQQTTVNFSHHRLVAPAPSLQEARVEIGWRSLLRLAALVGERIEAMQARALDLAGRKSALASRLRRLQAQQAGLDDSERNAPISQEHIVKLEQEIAEAQRELQETRISLASLDGYIDQINQVLGHPQQFFRLTQHRMQLDPMGFRVEPRAEEAAHTVDLGLTEVHISPTAQGIIEIVSVRRDLMPPKEDLWAQAERYL
jgi:hypothetical protein